MAEAYRLAVFSPDPSNQNGAVIVNSRQEVAEGFNHFPSGVPVEVKDREKKLERIVHAECDAIYDAAHRGYSTQGATMICPWAACKGCALAILSAQIKKLVIHLPRCNAYLEGRQGVCWQPEINEAMSWLRAGGVVVECFEDPLSDYRDASILVNGRRWNPKTCEFNG
jgi:dCMP deaminase